MPAISITLDDDSLTKVENLAKINDRSISAQIRVMIREYN